MKDKCVWLLLAVIYAGAFAANVGYFAWSYDVGWLQIAASAVYAAAWIWLSVAERGNRRTWRRLSAFMSGTMTAAGILGLLVRTLGGTAFTIPALLTAGIAVTPLYGLLSLVGDYDLFYGVSALLGVVWLWAVRRQAKRQSADAE